jgi:hypothetical protein
VPCSLALVSRPATRLRISGRRVHRRKRRRPRCASSKATTEKGLSTALDGSSAARQGNNAGIGIGFRAYPRLTPALIAAAKVYARHILVAVGLENRLGEM